MEKIQIDVNPSIIDKENASNNGFSNKMRISFPLLRTYPIINNNGDSFDFETSKEVHDSVEFGYINLEHEGWINVGVITNSQFVEEGGIGTIQCEGVLWKSVLDEFDISQSDIENGKFQISMEVFFTDFYVMVGDKKYEPPEGEKYLDYKGQTIEEGEVSRVIVPSEYSGAALTENAADKTLDIEKAVASKIGKGNDGGSGEEDNVEEKETEIEEENTDMSNFKEFETEEAFNKFLEEEGYVHVDEVVKEFEDLGFEEASDLEEVVSSVSSLQTEYEQYQKEVARERKVSERKTKLAENDIELDKIEASEEDLADMGEKEFDMLIKAYSYGKEKASEEVEEDVKKEEGSEGFDPTNFGSDDKDIDYNSIAKKL